MNNFIFTLLFFSILLIGCEADEASVPTEEKTENTSQEEDMSMKVLASKLRVFTVASEQLVGLSFSCGIEDTTKVYAVKEMPNQDWFALGDPIQGFEYFSGYEYVIEVEQKTFFDQSKGEPAWNEFFIVQVISMEEKQSENLPADFLPKR